MTDLIVTLTDYERNAATVALADTYRINARTEQENAADRAYYSLIAPSTFEEAVARLAGWMSTLEPYEHMHPENLKGHAERALRVALERPAPTPSPASGHAGSQDGPLGSSHEPNKGEQRAH